MICSVATPFMQLTSETIDGWVRGRIGKRVVIYAWPLKDWLAFEDRLDEAFGE